MGNVLTTEEAQAEARRRWGQAAWTEIWDPEYDPSCTTYLVGFKIPRKFLWWTFHIKKQRGIGPSWERAFMDADGRQLVEDIERAERVVYAETVREKISRDCKKRTNDE